MSRVLRAVWDNTYGLLVDDGQLAIGIAVSLAIAWAAATYGGDALRESVGWVLLVLLTALVVTNLTLAGQQARRKGTTPP
ncbi:MAG TPA: hypothetical protein VF998_11060 [Candidatus Limnocylindria bacterium]